MRSTFQGLLQGGFAIRGFSNSYVFNFQFYTPSQIQLVVSMHKSQISQGEESLQQTAFFTKREKTAVQLSCTSRSFPATRCRNVAHKLQFVQHSDDSCNIPAKCCRKSARRAGKLHCSFCVTKTCCPKPPSGQTPAYDFLTRVKLSLNRFFGR